MRICWDNLEKHNIHLTMDGKFRNRETKILFIYRDSCIICQEPFLINPYSTGTCCSYKCSGKLRSKLLKGSKHTEETKKKLSEIGRGRNHTEESKRKIGNKSKGRKHTEETKRKMSDSAKGRNHTEETKKKLSEIVRGRKHTEESKRKMSEVQKCYYIQNNLPKYDLYAHKIEWCEPVKRNQKDRNILDVRCDYCGKWYVSTIISVLSRIKAIFGKISGESRFYCSDNCKQECPIFNRSKWPKGFKLATSREVQPELRQMVLERDGYQCIKCGSDGPLHCHHVEGIRWNPLESTDVDMCITVCKECHKAIHQKDGCGYNDMKCLEAA